MAQSHAGFFCFRGSNMPWTAKDAESKTKKADTAKKREVWSEAANAARKQALNKGQSETEADGYAIRVANSAVASMKEDELIPEIGRLQEIAACQSSPLKLTVDQESGTAVLHDVLFLGTQKAGRGRENGVYSPEVVRSGIAQYDGAPTYVGHVKEGSNPDYKNKLGIHRNVRACPEGGRSDFHFNINHPCAKQLMWDAANDPTHVGFSADHDCSWDRDKTGRKIVKSINKVYSIDLVTRPATTHGLAEEETEHTPPSLQEETKMGVEWKDITVELLSTNCPDLVSKLQGTDEHTRLTEEVKTLKAAADTTAAELATLKAEKAARLREQEIAADLTAAKFPVNDPVVYSAEFKEELAAAPDKAKRDRLIKDRLAVAKGRLTEGGLPAPLANLKEDETDNRHHNSVNASLFVAK
jgi:hypothetical protein